MWQTLLFKLLLGQKIVYSVQIRCCLDKREGTQISFTHSLPLSITIIRYFEKDFRLPLSLYPLPLSLPHSLLKTHLTKSLDWMACMLLRGFTKNQKPQNCFSKPNQFFRKGNYFSRFEIQQWRLFYRRSVKFILCKQRIKTIWERIV